MDSRGVKRGKCKKCTECVAYRQGSEVKKSLACVCGCPPGKHVKDQCQQVSSHPSNIMFAKESSDTAITESIMKCLQCDKEVDFDVNSGEQYQYCKLHLKCVQECDGLSIPQNVSPIPPSPSILSTECAILECKETRFIDATGKVHECCGYTHAMELMRRKVIRKMAQPVVKGVTHCLLPDCNKLVWPFMNYCRKAHAEEGIKKGLKPPPQPGGTVDLTAPKDPSLCELPECTKPKHIENGKKFDFCGRRHADEAKSRGITITQTGPKTNDMCILEGCYRPKHKDSDGTVHDYCSLKHAEAAKSSADPQLAKDDSICIIPECSLKKSKDAEGYDYNFCGKRHAQEAEQRGIQSILTNMTNVKKFLEQFSNLTVVKIDENDHAKSGGKLYKKFIAARNNLPQADRKTQLAFHGTAEANIPSIFTNGYDPSRRKGQAYGPGEYFATSPVTPLGYCKGGKKLLLNELLLGQVGVHHTQHGDVIVMKNPEHDLPRFSITFQ